MRVMLYDNAFGVTPKVADLGWDEFVQQLGPHKIKHGITDKRQLPGFSPGEIFPGRTRSNENVGRLHAAVLDLDDVTTETIAAVLQASSGLQGALYTTWSHPEAYRARGLWRARLVVPLARPVDASEWDTTWPAIVRRFGAPTDPHCRDRSRMYFGAFTGPADTSLHHFVTWPGVPLDPSTLFDQSGPTPRSQADLQDIPRERLLNLARSWKRSKDENRAYLGLALSRIVDGEPFAEPGNRDNTLFQLARDLMRTWPRANPVSLANHFAQSIQLMSWSEADPLAKLVYAQTNIQQELEAKEREVVQETRTRMLQSWEPISPGRDFPYTQEELQDLQTQTRTTPQELNNRWIIQKGPTFYILSPKGYSSPYMASDAYNAALRDLAPASSAGVDLWSVSKQGEWTRKTLDTLMSEYGSVATNVVLDLRAQHARYDSASHTFYEAPTPVRLLSPEFDPKVHHWLELFAGPKQLNDLLSWLALSTDLSSTCAALVMTGPGDTGKNLFVHGVSRQFSTTQPTTLEQALSGFNDALARSPIEFADEQLPKDYKGHARTGEIREFIGTLSRPFHRKFIPDAVLLGAIRLCVAANNEDILNFNENLTRNDIVALGDRFLHLRIPQYEKNGQPRGYASDYLNALGPIEVATFVSHERIAKHALWLRDNYPVVRNGRFLIRNSGQEDLIRAMSTKGGIRSAVCQWLIGYLKNPLRLDARGEWMVRIHQRRLLVNTQAILDNWSAFVENEPVPSAGRLATAIGNLSTGTRIHLGNPKGGTTHYRQIDIAHLYMWSEQTELGTREDIDTALATDTETRVKTVIPARQGFRLN